MQLRGGLRLGGKRATGIGRSVKRAVRNVGACGNRASAHAVV